MQLLLTQVLNGIQFGVTLFLLAAGLTLIFGIMRLINLAHGVLFMVGAYVGVTVALHTNGFWLGVIGGMVGAAVTGVVIEVLVVRRLYSRSPLDQVLATFGLILIFNQLVRLIWGTQPLSVSLPNWLSGRINIIPGIPYPTYRLAIVIVGVLVGIFLYLLIMRTRLGIRIRAGASNREMIGALGINIVVLYTAVFGLGAGLAGLGGIMVAPFTAVQSGMGSQILIMTFVVIVIGGIGSIRGAAIGAILVGLVSSLSKAYLPNLFSLWLPTAAADSAGTSVASMAIYIVMAAVLVFRPQGLLGAHEP